MQTRVVSLLCKSFLHFLKPLSTSPEEFLALWQRLLTLLGACYAEPTGAGGVGPGESVREAVGEYVRNTVSVVFAEAGPGGNAAHLAALPTFWTLTRELLPPFGDVGTQLTAYLDAQGLGAPAGPGGAGAAPPPTAVPVLAPA